MLSSVKSPSLARRSVTTYVGSLLILAGCLAIGVRLFRDSDRYERQDFNRYYAEASVLRSGGNPWRIFEFSPPKDMNEPAQVGYPPAFYFMFSPLCRFRPATAHWLWEVLQIIALISALTIVLREIGRTATNTFIRLAFAFLFPPLHSALHWGQPTALLLLLLVGSWACARRGWEMSAGTLLAIATLLKILPWVVCGYFLFRRRWKVLASSLICALAISLCLLALYGIDRNLDFLRGTQISAIWLDRRRNLSIIGNLHAIVVGSGEGRTLDLRLLGLLIAFFCLSIVSVSGILTSRLPNEPAETSGLCWSLWIMSSILLSPVSVGSLSRSANTYVYFSRFPNGPRSEEQCLLPNEPLVSSGREFAGWWLVWLSIHTVLCGRETCARIFDFGADLIHRALCDACGNRGGRILCSLNATGPGRRWSKCSACTR